MAIVTCTECKKPISDKAVACPHCGAQRIEQASLWWRVLKMFLVLTGAAILLVMCGVYNLVNQVKSSGTATSSSYQPNRSGGTSCQVSDISITSTRARHVDHCRTRQCIVLEGIGVMNNGCAEAVGVQVKITSYDNNGGAVATREMWPASVRNIPPGTYEFSIDQWLDYDPTAKSFILTPVAVKRW